MDVQRTGRIFGWLFIGTFVTSIPARLLFVSGLDANASATFTTEMMLMRPIAAKTDSMRRALTYPSETVSLGRLTSG